MHVLMATSCIPSCPPQESYDQHLLVCHNFNAISSALSLLAEGSVISSGAGTCQGTCQDLGCHSDSSDSCESSSSSSGDSSGHEYGSPRASRLALQLCMVLATSAAGRKVGNTVLSGIHAVHALPVGMCNTCLRVRLGKTTRQPNGREGQAIQPNRQAIQPN